jgi:hypothetical protein
MRRRKKKRRRQKRRRKVTGTSRFGEAGALGAAWCQMPACVMLPGVLGGTWQPTAAITLT